MTSRFESLAYQGHRGPDITYRQATSGDLRAGKARPSAVPERTISHEPIPVSPLHSVQQALSALNNAYRSGNMPPREFHQQRRVLQQQYNQIAGRR